jgi:hypothetical protein
MRYFFTAVMLLCNLAIFATFGQVIFERGLSFLILAFSVLISGLFACTSVCLIIAILNKNNKNIKIIMRLLCLSIPITWGLGSLDYGILSGLELWSVLLITIFSWGTWRAFCLFKF